MNDVVLLGATGFTGALVAEQLAQRAGDGVTWALAGRNREKLARVAEQLGVDVELLSADVTDERSMRDLAEGARVVASTVGPYLQHGEPLVAACAQAGTDYVDLTGEPEFVDRMYVAYHAQAASTGARIVHSCGFDSIPHDLGAQFNVEHLPEDAPLSIRGFVQAGGTFSGGTFASALGALGRIRQSSQAHSARRRLEGEPTGRRVRASRDLPYREAEIGAWALPFPSIDPQVVASSARSLPRYGPDFSYGHFIAVKRLPAAVGLAGGAAGLVAAAQLPPARTLLGKLRAQGDGPSPEQREKGWFRVTFVGKGGGQRVVSQVTGGDPGYGETSKMLAEAALCLAGDDLPETAGQVTTATAMGPALRGRLERAGIGFSVVG